MFGLRQPQGFGKPRGHARQRDLVDHFGGLPRARLADMDDEPRIGAHHRARGLYRIGAPAAHQRERASLGTWLGAGHRRIDAMDVLVTGLNRDLAGNPRRNGGMVDEQSARRQRRKDAVGREHDIGQIIVIANAGDHHLGIFGCGGGAVRLGHGDVGVGIAPFRQPVGGAAVDCHRVAGMGQMTRDRPTHHAKANDGNAARDGGCGIVGSGLGHVLVF